MGGRIFLYDMNHKLLRGIIYRSMLHRRRIIVDWGMQYGKGFAKTYIQIDPHIVEFDGAMYKKNALRLSESNPRSRNKYKEQERVPIKRLPTINKSIYNT